MCYPCGFLVVIVKYQALIETCQKENGLSTDCRVVLFLEAKFPEEFSALKNTSSIDVLDEV